MKWQRALDALNVIDAPLFILVTMVSNPCNTDLTTEVVLEMPLTTERSDDVKVLTPLILDVFLRMISGVY